MKAGNDYNTMTVKELMEIAKHLGIKGRHELKKDELVKKINEINEARLQEGLKKQQLIREQSEKKSNTGEDIKQIMELKKMEKVAKKAVKIIDKHLGKAPTTRGPRKAVIIVHESKEYRFEKTYEASKWLSEIAEVTYSTVDRYLVSKLKGREVKIPKALLETPLMSMNFRYEK